MDAHLFRAFASSLEPMLTGSRIEKIQEFAPGHLALVFFGGGQKRNLYMRFGRKEPFSFLSTLRVTGLGRPSPQVMRMRKYFAGRRVAAVVIQEWSRRIWLLAGHTCDSGGKTVWLCLDLVEGASIHFFDAENLPEPEIAVWPQVGEIADALENWRSWPVLTPSLRKTLREMEPLEQAALLADLAEGAGDIFLYCDTEGSVRKISAWPLPKSHSAGLEESVSGATLQYIEKAGQDLVLGALAEQKSLALLTPGKRRERQIRKIMDTLAADEERLWTMVAKQADAQALAANLWRLNTGTKSESIELEARKIALDSRFTLKENMERLFNEARRGKRGLAMLAQRRQALESELANVASFVSEPVQQVKAPAPAAVNLPPHTQAFLSSDGYLILRGKDAKGNLAIRRLTSGHDIWAHVEKGVGAHVIIRRPHVAHEIPERTLIEAGTLAANKSWLAQAASGSVMYAEVRHVKPRRGGAPGNVTIDKIRETLVVPVDHSLEEILVKYATPVSPDGVFKCRPRNSRRSAGM